MKAYLAFRLKGTTTFLPIGNAPAFVYEPEVENTEHFSSQVGPKVKDADIVLQVGANLSLTLDEITAQNIALVVNGTIGSLIQPAVSEAVVNVGAVISEQVIDIGSLNVTDISFVDNNDVTLVENVDYKVISHESGIYVFTASQNGVVATVTAGAIEESEKRSIISILSAPEGIEGEFMVVGTGTGRRLKGTGIYANLKSASGLGLISEDISQIELTGSVLRQPGPYPFGKFEQTN
tara:strand:- start:22093 stop:22800 length:708 start_codon:yes stop_codon:yes gene_type:complete